MTRKGWKDGKINIHTLHAQHTAPHPGDATRTTSNAMTTTKAQRQQAIIKVKAEPSHRRCTSTSCAPQQCSNIAYTYTLASNGASWSDTCCCGTFANSSSMLSRKAQPVLLTSTSASTSAVGGASARGSALLPPLPPPPPLLRVRE